MSSSMFVPPMKLDSMEDCMPMARITSTNSINNKPSLSSPDPSSSSSIPSFETIFLLSSDIPSLPSTADCMEEWENSSISNNSTTGNTNNNSIGQLDFGREVSLSEFSYESELQEFSPITESNNYSEQEENNVFTHHAILEEELTNTMEMNYQELSEEQCNTTNITPIPTTATVDSTIKPKRPGRPRKNPLVQQSNSYTTTISTTSTTVSYTNKKRRSSTADCSSNTSDSADEEKSSISDNSTNANTQNSEEVLDKRQRNKVSASQYRKRRKMYVQTLEQQVNNLNSTLEKQTDKMSLLQTENKVLKEQLEFMKKLLNNNNSNPNSSSSDLSLDDLTPTANTIRLPSTTQIPPQFRPQPPSNNSNNNKSKSKKLPGSGVGMILFVLFSCFIFYSPIFTDNNNISVSSPASASLENSLNSYNYNSVPITAGRAGRLLLNVIEDTELSTESTDIATELRNCSRNNETTTEMNGNNSSCGMELLHSVDKEYNPHLYNSCYESIPIVSAA